MSATKSLIVLLSLVLCFCLLSKQASQGYAMDFDLPAMVDVPHVEDGQHDLNDPVLLTKPHPESPAPLLSVFASPGEFYRQPAIPLFLRPPTA